MSRRNKRRSKRSSKLGTPPGTLVHVGEQKAEAVEISVMDFDPAGYRETRCQSIRECQAFRKTETISWINVNGLHDVGLIAEAGEIFGIHPLVQEDILNTEQRPKLEDYDDYIYLVLRMLRPDGDRRRILAEQVSIVLGSNFVLSFQEAPGDVFEGLRDRIRGAKGRVLKMGSDYLVNCMVDAVLDGYFATMEEMSDRVEDLENRLIADPTPQLLGEIYEARRECAFLRKCAWPLRDMITSFERSDSALVKEETFVYVRDLLDHALRIIETIEILRDTIAGMLEMYLSSASNRMNEVMKVLTVIATVFIPLTFIAGVYGMNFKWMPETDWPWSYPILWVVMIVLAAGMLRQFRKKKWI